MIPRGPFASLVVQMVKESACNVGDWGSLGWEDPREKGMATHSNILAWRIPMDRGAWWAGCSPQGRKELDMTEQLSSSDRGLFLNTNISLF